MGIYSPLKAHQKIQTTNGTYSSLCSAEFSKMKKFKNLDLMAHQISTLMLRHEVPEDEVRHVFIGQGTVL